MLPRDMVKIEVHLHHRDLNKKNTIYQLKRKEKECGTLSSLYSTKLVIKYSRRNLFSSMKFRIRLTDEKIENESFCL